jgi:hypothetical protein
MCREFGGSSVGGYSLAALATVNCTYTVNVEHCETPAPAVANAAKLKMRHCRQYQ